MQPIILWQVEFKMGQDLPTPGMWTWPQQESHQDQQWKQEERPMAVQYSNMEPSLMELSLGDGMGIIGWTPQRLSISIKKVPAGLKVCKTNPKYVVYLLLKFSFSWFSGPKLPRGMSGLTLVQTSQGTYAMGGAEYGGKYRTEVLQLDCPGDQIQSCQWKEMEQKLEVGRFGHVSIPLPESYDICHKGSYGSKIEGAISDYWNYLTDIYNDFKTKATKKTDPTPSKY